MKLSLLFILMVFILAFNTNTSVSGKATKKDGDWSRIEYDASFYKGQGLNLTFYNYGSIIDKESLYYNENHSIYLTAYSVSIDGEQVADMYLTKSEAYKPTEWDILSFETNQLSEGEHQISIQLIGTVFQFNSSEFDSSIQLPDDRYDFGIELLIEIKLNDLIIIISWFLTPILWFIYYRIHTGRLQSTYRNYTYLNSWPMLFSPKRLPITIPLIIVTGYAYLNSLFSPLVNYLNSTGSYYLNKKIPSMTGLEPEWVHIIAFSSILMILIPVVLSFLPPPDQMFGDATITPLTEHKLQYAKRRHEAMKEVKKDEKLKRKFEKRENKRVEKEQKENEKIEKKEERKREEEEKNERKRREKEERRINETG